MATRVRKRRPRRLPMGAWFLVAMLLLVAAYAGTLELSRPHVDGRSLRFDQFADLVEDGRVRSARILDADSIVVGTYERANGGVERFNTPFFREDRNSLLVELLGDVPTTVDQQVTKAVVLPALLVLLPVLLFVVVFLYLIASYREGTGLFRFRKAALVKPEDSRVRFADVAGQDAAVRELREVAEFLSDPERFAAVGARVPRGVLLYGPPGCGKTLLARALAGEAGATFFSVSGSSFVELFVGVGASRMRDLFRTAREHAPAIVFIDELDSIARRRTAGEGVAHTEQEDTLNQILAELDGFSPLEGVIIVGATNRPNTLDPALLRPGRFDRWVGLELPDERGRMAILEVHARGKPLAADADLAGIARRSVGTTGADLASIVNEAGLLAARASRRAIAHADLEQALERVLEAPERRRRLSMRDGSIGRRTVAEDRVTFADVAGADDALAELREIKDFLGAPDRYAALGARIPRGFLLAGPPGCGKTLLARAVAGEANAAFISAAATEFVMRYVGEGAARVRDLFAEARAMAPAVLFIDEIDAVGGSRGTMLNDHSERHQTLNQILIELDGFSPRAGVVVIAATNRPDRLDAALVRPGRFDRHVFMELPDVDGRRAILALHARDKPLAPDADLDAVARLTAGMSGADLANIVNEAALLAARAGGSDVRMTHLEEAVERAGLGIGGARRVSEHDRRVVAYHEAGHGLVTMALPGGGRILHKLTIVPRGGSLGAAWSVEPEDRHTRSRTALIERMAAMLGGKAAEEIVFGEPSAGATNDLAVVGDLAHRMVAEMGMSKVVGAINHRALTGPDGRPAHSEDTARLIDAEARALVEEAEDLAHRILRDARDALDRVVAALEERETLALAEVEEIVGPALVRR